MKNISLNKYQIILLGLNLLFIGACITPKNTAVSKRLQNLTARYNFIYNANELLDKHKEAQITSYEDNYELLLPVYLDPPVEQAFEIKPTQPHADMDKIISKANYIINEKTYSNYIDDAYMLLGRASFYKADYFTAKEYFDYTARNYKEQLPVYIMALNWKVRTLRQLNKVAEAQRSADTMLRAMEDLKKPLAEPLASTAQLYIDQSNYGRAITLLTQAIAQSKDSYNRTRWTFLLAQLQETQELLPQAEKNYLKVVKSNAPFEMYFQANLSALSLASIRQGEVLNKEKALLALLKDDKNENFIDQIYYNIAQLFYKDRKFTDAKTYYEKSIASSKTKNMQKGLSYLGLAELNFKDLNQYKEAKLYYDSAVNTLPEKHPNYKAIQNKAQHLEYLTERLENIQLQDTLQYFATLQEDKKSAEVFKYLFPTSGKTTPKTPSKNTNLASSAFPAQQAQNMAFLKGSDIFKTRWGNRPLKDFWRQSGRQDNPLANNTDKDLAEVAVIDSSLRNPEDSLKKVKVFIENLPQSPDKIAHSNALIVKNYLELADFYKDELQDIKEANNIYKLLLKKYPQNEAKARIYYQLYHNLFPTDQNQAVYYKELLVQEFPNSNFVKAINNPRYGSLKAEDELLMKKSYEEVFDLFLKRNYAELIEKVDQLVQQPYMSALNPQLRYLDAIAIGRTQPLGPLVTAFQNLAVDYPTDSLITPLVLSHLNYLEEHRAEYINRKIALIDFDEKGLNFIEPAKPAVKEKIIAAKVTEPAKAEVAKPTVKEVAEPLAPKTIFSTAKSDTYYFVIDVSDVTQILSSSRFGLGQFNRGTFPENNLSHKLVELDEDQLLYVGEFVDLEDALYYAESIKGQMKNIMKVPEKDYQTFVISKENFQILTDKSKIAAYIEFYKNYYK